MRYFCVAPYLLAFFRPFFFWDTQLDDCMNAEFEWLQMSACQESNLGSNSEARNGWDSISYVWNNFVHSHSLTVLTKILNLHLFSDDSSNETGNSILKKSNSAPLILNMSVSLSGVTLIYTFFAWNNSHSMPITNHSKGMLIVLLWPSDTIH